ncbi:anti-sigma-factor antagonist [Xylanimonas cellulosilytica DSM 15894]|uniref:Anti-sigma-factor antagonist n=1 Tax=Xylanimonas cellulosilytica (strain DSM 15894 / JCM 12276 / CECT 5975 / KCTC 9989 / LMG 20990 / NBRC 107835 / XIL07) TaxID=446471 RepID=D1BTW2_XYLCX|nr:STAS domain-containing protein [Xylanimonas cellulosilytica]ACZ29126.1 anti-sigma-factor antagonist [Xylanimonas cellulosilytica DSM 15894]
MDLDQTEQRTATGSGISCRTTADGTVVTLWGEVDAALREAAGEVMALLAVHATGIPVVIEAKDVTFIDSSGIAFILQVYVLGQETGTPVSLRDPSEAVVEVLDMVGIGGRIPVVHESGEAS